MDDNNLFYRTKVPRLYMQMAIPSVLSMLVGLVYNLTDTYFVAATQNTDLVAAVSLCAPVFTLLMALGNIFGLGGSTLVSRLLGDRRNESVRTVSAWCFYGALAVGLAVGTLMLIFRRPMLTLLGANSETYAHARDYYLVMAAGSPVVVCTFIHTNLLRTEGLVKESLVASIGGSMVNIILDPIFILLLGWGAAGAAFATVLGYLFTVSYAAAAVKRKSSFLSLRFRNKPMENAHIGQIMAVGLSAAVTNLMGAVSVIFLNQSLLTYGNDRVAAMGIASKVSLIVFFVLDGLSFGGQPLFGFYYGANDRKRLKETISFSLKLNIGAAVGLSAPVFILAPQLISIFLQDQTIAAYATLMLRLQVATMAFAGLIMLMSVLFQSIGLAVPALVLSLCRQGILFIVLLLGLRAAFGYMGVISAQAAADAVSLFVALGLFARYGRKKLL